MPIKTDPPPIPPETKKWIEGYKEHLKNPIIKPKERNWITPLVFIIIGVPAIIWLVVDFVLYFLLIIDLFT